VVPLGDRADGDHSASIRSYLTLLESEIAAAGEGPPLSTVYLGGGTPSLLTPGQVGRLLGALDRRFGLAAGAEISLELDPASFDVPRLRGYLAAGVNRVSLGGQSFDDGVLLALGRRHRAEDLAQAIAWLQQARGLGLRSWSLDLIQGLPLSAGATATAVQDHWQAQLRTAIEAGAPHLSIYDLIVEPGTVFERRQQRGELLLPDDDLSADLMALTWAELVAAGYGHYEISNYAVPGHASRHNRVYWSGAGWWGFGMGATGAPWGRRQPRPRTRQGYATWLEQGQAPSPAIAREPAMPLDERLMVGLRRREGVNGAALLAAEGVGPEAVAALRGRLRPHMEAGWLRLEGSRWRLSDPDGLALSNAVLREILAWWQEQPQRIPGD
jgi:oxygen-independent coproporphyrinogen-3 oxidase